MNRPLLNRCYSASAERQNKIWRQLYENRCFKFNEGDMPKAERDAVHIILRACKSGQPDIKDNRITVEGKSYTTI